LRKIINELSWQVIVSIKNAGRKSTSNYINEKTKWFRGSSKAEEDMKADDYLGIHADEDTE